MKKWLKITLIIAGVFIICVVLDVVSIYTMNKPVFAIKYDCDCADQVYHGLLYDTYNCHEYSAPQIKAKWVKYTCSGFQIKTNEKDGNGWYDGDREYTIIDTSKDIPDFVCAEALEEIYRDDDYTYYLPCIKSEYIKVRFKNGDEIYLKDALKDKKVSISDLDTYGIQHYKYEIED